MPYLKYFRSSAEYYSLRFFRIQAAHNLGRYFLAIALVVVTSHASAEQETELEAARNFHAISDDLLTSGQVYPSQIESLKAAGVEMVLNLAVADPEQNAEEAFAVMSAGITYINIPVLWSEPTQADLELFFDFMDARDSRTTLVHCFANYRASAFTYLYRVLREGVAEEDARKDLLAVWNDEAFAANPTWRRFNDDNLRRSP